jgi:hypothetical protein
LARNQLLNPLGGSTASPPRYAEPIHEVNEEYEEANAEIEDEDFDGRND